MRETTLIRKIIWVTVNVCSLILLPLQKGYSFSNLSKIFCVDFIIYYCNILIIDQIGAVARPTVVNS